MTSGDTLVGGNGNDVIVAGSGDETLVAGATGNETLVGGQGNDVLQGESSKDVFDIEFGNNGGANLAVEKIVDSSGLGVLYINNRQPGTLTLTGVDTWTDGTYDYKYISGSDSASELSDVVAGTPYATVDWAPEIGVMQITPALQNTTAVLI